MKNQGPGARGGLSFQPGTGTGGGCQKPRRGPGSEADSSPGSRGGRTGKRGPPPPAPLVHSPQVRPAPLTRPGATRRERPRAAPPPLAWSELSLTAGFYLQPRGPVGSPRRGSCRRRQRKRVSLGQEGRRSRIQRGAPGPARAVSASARASEHRAPAAAAAAPEQPPPAPGARLSCEGASGAGTPWRPPSEWQLPWEGASGRLRVIVPPETI